MTKKPELQDFGIAPEEYALYKGQDCPLYSDRASLAGAIVTPLVVATVTFVITGNPWTAAGYGVFGIIPGSLFGAVVFGQIVIAMARSKWNRTRAQLLKSPVASQIKLYEKAMANYTEEEREAERTRQEAERVRRAAGRARWEAERAKPVAPTPEPPPDVAERARWEAERARRRKLIDHWLSLSGRELESEMEVLCKRVGYRVESTPVSGDGGIDLILRNKSNEKVVVQCKSYKSPVGPAAVRELYGSMMHFGVSKAVLVCPAGFTQGVKEFVKGKPIELVAAEDLISLAASTEAMEKGEKSGTRQS